MAVTLILGLTGCGGNHDAPTPATTGLTLINAANASRVAGEAIHSFILPLNAFSSLVANNFVLGGLPPSAVARSRLLHVASAGNEVRPLAAVNSSTPCSTSGQSTVIVSQAVERQVGVGDFVEKQFAACVQEGVQSDGKARETVTAVNAAQTVFDAQGELTGFSSTEAGVAVMANGAYGLTFDRSNATLVKISASVNQSINVERRINQRANAAYTLKALTRTVEVNLAADALIFKFDYIANGSFPQLGLAQFQVNTPENLAVGFEDGATKGAVKVIGTDGSNLLLTFLGDSVDTVRLDLDANGDSTIDQTQTRTSEELLKLVLAAQ